MNTGPTSSGSLFWAPGLGFLVRVRNGKLEHNPKILPWEFRRRGDRTRVVTEITPNFRSASLGRGTCQVFGEETTVEQIVRALNIVSCLGDVI